MKKPISNLIKMVKLLNDNQYHDGTSLGESLQITRAGIWKIIQKLENYGVVIDSIKGKGYLMPSPLILLDEKEIKHKLNNTHIDLAVFESIDSTNDYLKSFFHLHEIKICLAEQQTHGRGRLNRPWHGSFGQNIYLSVLYPFECDIGELSGLSLIVSLAILQTLKNYPFPIAPVVKWPNDILWQHKKLAGVLVEIQAETHGACSAIIGIGINVNMLTDENRDISQPWVSMKKILNQDIDRNELASMLIKQLMTYLNQFQASGFNSFAAEWKSADYLTNQKLTLQSGSREIQGKAKGVNALGYLQLELTDGTLQAFSSGEARILK